MLNKKNLDKLVNVLLIGLLVIGAVWFVIAYMSRY